MDIYIRSQQVRAPKRMYRAIENIVSQALRKYSGKIRAVQLSLSDINGPRGGVDKRCIMRISMVPRGLIVITAEARKVGIAIRQALRRAGEKMHRRLKRVQNG